MSILRSSSPLFVLAALWLTPIAAQPPSVTVVPHPAWDCGMPAGIPDPDRGTLLFEVAIPLERVAAIGRTQYGNRRVAVGREGRVTGQRLSANVMEGALDFELTLANGAMEIEQIIVLRAADGAYILARNAGTGATANDVRVVMDFEAPNTSAHAWLNTGSYVARRDLDADSLTLRVYDVSGVAVNAAGSVKVEKPAGVPAQPWDYRQRGADERQGEVLITENVTLAPSQSVGASKRGGRNIIPITGGTVSGRLQGKVLMGGADYQNLTPPVTIDARYLWQADDGEIIIVRNGGSFGSLVPTFEARIDGPYAYLNNGRYWSSNPGMGQGGVALTFYESAN